MRKCIFWKLNIGDTLRVWEDGPTYTKNGERSITDGSGQSWSCGIYMTIYRDCDSSLCEKMCFWKQNS